MTEEERKEVLRRIHQNDETITQSLGELTQFNSGAVFDVHQALTKALENNPIGLAILHIGMFEYSTRIFNDLLDQNRKESEKDE